MDDLMNVIDNSDLTPIEIALGIDEEGKTTARKLYEFLELAPSQFARWAKTNIEQNQFFEENLDWQRFDIVSNGNETCDYKLTIEFAKHLSMSSQSSKGKIARAYFIKVEDKLRQATKPMSMSEIVQYSINRIVEQEREMKEIKAVQELQGAKLKLLEAKIETRNDDYFTVPGYASLKGIKIEKSKYSSLGRKCSKLSKEMKYPIGKIKDPRFGEVGTYHVDILKMVVEQDK